MSIRQVKHMLDHIIKGHSAEKIDSLQQKGGLPTFWWCSGQVLLDPALNPF